MKEELNHGGQQEALGIGEAQYAQAVTVNQRINEQTGVEEVLLNIQTNVPGRYDTELGAIRVIGVKPVTDPRSRAQSRLTLGSEGWLQKSSHTTVRHRNRPRSIDLIDAEGRQQLPSAQGRERWLMVSYQAPQT